MSCHLPPTHTQKESGATVSCHLPPTHTQREPKVTVSCNLPPTHTQKESGGAADSAAVGAGGRITHLLPSKPTSDPWMVSTPTRAYALATRRFRSKTMILAQISSSIESHLERTSLMWSWNRQSTW